MRIIHTNRMVMVQDGDDTETPGRWSHVWPRHHSCLCNAPIILLGYVELSKKKKKKKKKKKEQQCSSVQTEVKHGHVGPDLSPHHMCQVVD